MLEGDGQHATAAGEDARRPDDALDRPVAAFHEHVGPAGTDEGLGGIVVEPGHCADGFERRHHRRAILQPVQRPLGAFAEPAGRGIAVQRDEQARAFGAGAREIGDVTAMQQVEDAVGEDQRARQLVDPARSRAGVADLRLEGGRGYDPAFRWSRGRQRSSSALQYSNTFTTLRTPPVLRVMSTTSSASPSVTTPIR